MPQSGQDKPAKGKERSDAALEQARGVFGANPMDCRSNGFKKRLPSVGQAAGDAHRIASFFH
jgi:hypothetical protein